MWQIHATIDTDAGGLVWGITFAIAGGITEERAYLNVHKRMLAMGYTPDMYTLEVQIEP